MKPTEVEVTNQIVALNRALETTKPFSVTGLDVHAAIEGQLTLLNLCVIVWMESETVKGFIADELCTDALCTQAAWQAYYWLMGNDDWLKQEDLPETPVQLWRSYLVDDPEGAERRARNDARLQSEVPGPLEAELSNESGGGGTERGAAEPESQEVDDGDSV